MSDPPRTGMNHPLAFPHDRNYGCRIRDFVYRGHRLISLENERLRVVMAPDKGADILELLYKPLDVECLWRSRAGLRPEPVRFSSPLATGHFREYFPGGWHLMLPNGPEPCTHRGAEFGFHGEATLLPWDCAIERDDPERIDVSFRVRTHRIPLFVERHVSLEQGSATLRVTECVVSEAGHRVEILWGHHPTFGWPLVDAGSRIFLPACTAVVGEQLPTGSRLAPGQRRPWPVLAGADGREVDVSTVPAASLRFHDFVRIEDLAGGWFAIVNPARPVGLALSWDHRLFPVLGLWHVWGGGPDYPWYGAPHLLALEPACDLPSLAKAVVRGTAIALEPGAAIEITLEATVFEGLLEVTDVRPGGVVQ